MKRSRQLAAIMFTDIVGYTALMGGDEDKAFQLIGLEPPVENKPACFFVTRPSKTHKGVIVKSVERLANSVKTNFSLIRNLDVYDLVNPLEDLNDSNSFFSEQRGDLH